MLYLPQEVFNPLPSLGAGVVYAGVRAAIDFVAEDNKPWSYYLGSFLGGTALATGIPNAAATIFVVGQAVDLAILKSQEGSDVQFFLNGVLQAQVDAYSLASLWDTVSIAGLSTLALNRIDIVNAPSTNSSKSSSINWLALGNVTVTGGYALAGSAQRMITVVYRLQDAEQSTQYASVPVNLQDGLTVAQVQTWSDAFAAELDAVSGSQIREASLTLPLTLPGGIKSSPLSGILNERGGLISFDTSGPRADSFRIPGIRLTIMPGDTFSLADAAVAALITRLTTATTAANARPRTAQDYTFNTARKGSKSFRK